MVKNKPIKYFDKLGLDIWVENTTSVQGFHKRICVTTWDGPYDTKLESGKGYNICCIGGKYYKKSGKYCISFGVDNNGEEGDGSSSGGSGDSSGGSEDGGSSDGDSSDEDSSTGADEPGTPKKPKPDVKLPPGFGPIDENGDGVVYEDLVDKATKENQRKKLLCISDISIRDKMINLVGTRANYALCGQSCRDFSDALYDQFDNEYTDRP